MANLCPYVGFWKRLNFGSFVEINVKCEHLLILKRDLSVQKGGHDDQTKQDKER